MMKKLVVYFVTLMAMRASTASEARGFDDLTKDVAYINDVIDCVLYNKACDDYGLRIRELIPDALNNNCKKCDSDEKQKLKLMSGFMKTVYPDLWRKIQDKYRAVNYIHTDY